MKREFFDPDGLFTVNEIVERLKVQGVEIVPTANMRREPHATHVCELAGPLHHRGVDVGGHDVVTL